MDAAAGKEEAGVVDQGEIVQAFLRVAQLATLSLAESDIHVDFRPAPHRRPTRLPADRHGVYVFLLGATCLKVGKAGPKSAARFCSHHYGHNAQSTLARSILAHPEKVAARLPARRGAEVMALSKHGVGAWIEANTCRMNVLLPCSTGRFALSLLESFLQCRLKPLFEDRAT
jgi:hypothetical protein